MATIPPGFVHQFLVSLHRFDTSIDRVMEKTFQSVNFDRDKSLTPTYIGIDVDYQPDPELQKVIRSFFKNLRRVHQRNFVRFVTDTLWAMESCNGDIFYCHDSAKERRCDVLWTIKVLDRGQVVINVLNTPDNNRREILTDLQSRIGKQFQAPSNGTVDERLNDVLGSFYKTTKNIRSVEFLEEDCHFILVPTHNRQIYRPVMVCGISSSDARRRWRGICNQIESQLYNYPRLGDPRYTEAELLKLPLGTINDNGLPKHKGFCPRVHYNNVEQAYAIFEETCVLEKSPNDIIIFDYDSKPFSNVTTYRYPLKFLAEIL